jgi:hypothetical protein
VRAEVIDTVVAAQAIVGAPVTAREAQDARFVMRTPRAFTDVAQAIARLGPDDRGRELCCAGTDRNGFALWWVKEPAADQFQNEMIAALQRLGSRPTVEAYALEEVLLQKIAPPGANWEPLMHLRMKLING